tara:strand:+ start:354 stop:1103 length:750 start_codon:yes stop_codon:yes gene_type:complete
MKKKIYVHFSVDDVFKSLIEITDKNIELKKHWFFSQFYKLWKKHKIKTGLYLFFSGKVNGRIRYLTEVRNINKELKENWIFFGPHALDTMSPPHKFSIMTQKQHLSKIYNEILRFSGAKYLTKKVRLHEYSESFELKKFFEKYKVLSLFSTDKDVGAHRLPKKNKEELLKFGITEFRKFQFIRTDFRIENFTKNNKILIQNKTHEIFNKRKFLTIYSHEYELEKKICRKNLFETINFLSKNYIIKSIKP